MEYGQIPGNQRFTAGGNLGKAGRPKRVFLVSHECIATSSGTIKLHDATSAASTADVFVTINGTSGNGIITDLGGAGIQFPNGCWVECSANSGVNYAVIVYQEEL